MNRNEFIERINKEYDEFKKNIMELSKEEIYERGFEIDFYTYMANYLTQEENDYLGDQTIANLCSFDDGTILDTLYEIYLNEDGSYTYDDLCDDILEQVDMMCGYEDADL